VRAGEALGLFGAPLFAMAALLAIAIYCIWQAIRDYRRGNYAMAVAGAICAALSLLVPIQTHAVKIDLPAER